MPHIIHTFDTWFTENKTDLYYLGLKHTLPPAEMRRQGLLRDHDRLQAMLREWQAKHLAEVETFMLASNGQLEGAGQYLGLVITPEQVEAYATAHEDENGVSRDPLVQMYCQTYAAWQCRTMDR